MLHELQNLIPFFVATIGAILAFAIMMVIVQPKRHSYYERLFSAKHRKRDEFVAKRIIKECRDENQLDNCEHLIKGFERKHGRSEVLWNTWKECCRKIQYAR